jgi:methylmalonyl-CoA mutase cobalamin-binding domain/chain
MENEIIENLKNSLKSYDKARIIIWAKKAVDENLDPLKAINALTEAIREVGGAFERDELFLPELVGAAQTMKAAVPILEKELIRKDQRKKSVGTVIAGTVSGDIHDIGISILCTLLTAAGFDVHYLGVDIPAQKFVDAVKEKNADILALSALLTMTGPEQEKVIDILKKEGLRDKVKVIVGGAAINSDFAEKIGADGYDPTAPGGVKLATKMMSKAQRRI